MTIFKKILLMLGITLIPFIIARIALLGCYRELFSELTDGEIFGAFVKGTRFDLASVIVFSSVPTLLLLCAGRVRAVYWVAGSLQFGIFLLLALVLAGDLVYFGYVKRHLTYELQFVLSDPKFFLEFAWKELRLAGVLGLLVGNLVFAGWVAFWRTPTVVARWYGAKAALLLTLLVIYGRGGVTLKPIAIIDAFAGGNTAEGNLVLNGVFSASQSMLINEAHNYNFFSPEELSLFSGMAAETLQRPYPLQKTSIASHAEYNLVVFVVESLTSKYIDGLGGKAYGVTPFLDELLKQSVVFTRFYSHGQRSLEGLQTVLTGIPSLVGLPSVGTGLAVNFTRLGKVASDNGYSHLFVSSMPRRAFRFDSVAGAAGFSNYFGKEDIPMILNYGEDNLLGWDYEAFMFMGDKLNQVQAPFIAFNFPSTDHTPFPKLLPKFQKYPHHPSEESGFLNTLYYTDWALSEFFAFAQRQPWFERTFFIITGDHALAHYQSGDFLERFLIPLVVYAPKMLPPQRIDSVRSQLDLVPTYFDLLGWQGDYSVFGESVFKKKDEFALVKYGSVVGAVTDRGYLLHSLENRMEAKLTNGEAGTGSEYFAQLERKLLAFNQIIFQLVNSNRWAP